MTPHLAHQALTHFELYNTKPSATALEAMKTECKRLSKCFSDRDVKQHARYAAAIGKIVGKLAGREAC